jgi:serine protease Do
VGLAPRFGFPTSPASAVWTERPAGSAPAAVVPTGPWVELAHQLKPAVVNVNTQRSAEGPNVRNPGGDDDPSSRFFGQMFGNQPRRPVKSLGSGFIINASGYVVTNNHVIDGATEIRVTLADGREFPGKLVGRDPKTDLALVKIEASGLPVIPLGDSSALQVGEPVMAIGNPFGLQQTVTSGIVSATGRVIGEGPYDDFIQTDASINPGNSGGPLINSRGEAVGINTAILSRSGGSVGIGFAIPVNLAKSVVAQLAGTGHVVRGWLGVTVQPVTAGLAKGLGLPDTHGALVASVAADSPAQRAGVKAGDVVVKYDGRPVARMDDLPKAVAVTSVGREVPIDVLRDGKPVALRVKVAKLDDAEKVAAAAGPAEKGSLGLAVTPLTPEEARQLGMAGQGGVLVRDVEEGSVAAEAGIRPGDVIAEVDRHPVKGVDDLRKALARKPKGSPTVLLVRREGSSLYVALGA